MKRQKKANKKHTPETKTNRHSSLRIQKEAPLTVNTWNLGKSLSCSPSFVLPTYKKCRRWKIFHPFTSLPLDLEAPSLNQPEHDIDATFCIHLSTVPSSPSLIQGYTPVHLPTHCFSVPMQRPQLLGTIEQNVGVKKAGIARPGCGICIWKCKVTWVEEERGDPWQLYMLRSV